MTENVKFTGIPLDNLLYFRHSPRSFPGLHTFFCLNRVNRKLPLGSNVAKCITEVKVNQSKVENTYGKMCTSTLKLVKLRLQATQIPDYIFPEYRVSIPKV